MPCYHLFDQQKITFVHIPKNAGTSIYQWLRNNRGTSQFHGWPGHPTLATMRQDRSDIEFVMTSVRNPWARVVSYYAMLNDAVVGDNFLSDTIGVRKIKDFDDFIKSWLPEVDTTIKNLDSERFQKMYYSIMEPQCHWLSGETADLVLRQENMVEDFAQVQEMFGCSEPLPFANTTKHEDYRSYYTSATKKIVAGWHEQDIDTWKYTF